MLLGIKIIDLKTYIEIINGNGFNKFSNFIKEIEILYEGVKNYMAKDEQGKVTEKSFDEQLLGMYDAIFNHGDNYKEYENSVIELTRFSYRYIMDALSLLKKGLKY